MAGRAAKRRAVALAASLSVHGLLLVALVWELRVFPKYVDAPPDQVQLVRAVPSERHPNSVERPPLREAPRRAPNIAARVTSPTVGPAIIAAAQPQPQSGDLADLSKALRGQFGCDLDQLAHLSDAERATCGERLARDQRNGPEYLVDPDKRLAFDAAAARAQWFQQPFLAADPKHGCKLKVTENGAATRGGQDFRAGIACGFSF